VMDICRDQRPLHIQMENQGHTAACFLYEEAE
jgi:hypothetical protein